jgi:ATP-dependent DNA helicase DinG
MNIAQRLSSVVRESSLENRPQQNEMALAINQALEGGGFLMVEAGTGVGKSFAYLIPALEYALKNGGPVVVSTHTLTLQEQLYQKDLPIVLEALEKEGKGSATAVLMKGRGNYLSKRRLALAMENNPQMDFDGEGSRLLKIQEWASTSAEGTLSSAGFPIPSEVWGEVKSDPFHCLGPKCQTFKTCFYHSVRQRGHGAHIILVNHALLLADLALKWKRNKACCHPMKS